MGLMETSSKRAYTIPKSAALSGRWPCPCSSPLLTCTSTGDTKRLQQYVNRELPDVQAGFRKDRGNRDQITNIHWIIGKAREFQKNIYFCFIDYVKAFDCVDHNKLWKILARRNINNLRYTDDINLMAESEEELKSLLMKLKEESEEAGLKHSTTKIMASGPITSWQIDGKTMETVSDFLSLGSKITADGDCSREIKGRLLLGRKAMINLDSILKSRDITLPTNVHLDKAIVFPVDMYVYESWTVKKADF